MTALGLSLEAALREREAAEWHLEALLHNQHQEMQACRQHLLQVGRQGWDSSSGCARAVPGRCQTAPGIPQVLRDQQRLAEEQRDALERRHRALLQDVLRDALELAEHNQHLRDTRRAGTADGSTQTP